MLIGDPDNRVALRQPQATVAITPEG